jgi:hypothetical protein
MLRQDPFANFLSDINQNLQLVEELETTLGKIHDTVSRRDHDGAVADRESKNLSELRRAAAF